MHLTRVKTNGIEMKEEEEEKEKNNRMEESKTKFLMNFRYFFIVYKCLRPIQCRSFHCL